jgi:hypothetical protein
MLELPITVLLAAILATIVIDMIALAAGARRQRAPAPANAYASELEGATKVEPSARRWRLFGGHSRS